ncbi:MAG: DegV family protein [Candidatus Heimdallarchaeota archaeon]|nr:DegV family protein [Candidatus Heimdallarchaeota archaeon]
MKIGVITDSAADLPKELMEKHKIAVIPHVVYFDDKYWKLGVDVSIPEFYNLIRTRDLIPPTTNPEPNDFVEKLEEGFDKHGFNHIFSVSVSKELSGSTFNSHRLAAKKFEDKVTVIDTHSASGVQGLIILAILELGAKGMSIKDIENHINKLKKNYFLDVGFHTLDNVYKSGRLKSKFVLWLTKTIKIKPVAIMQKPGILKSTLPGFFTNRSMTRRLANIAIRDTNKTIAYDLIISHVENQEGAEIIKQKLLKKLKINRFFITPVSPIIGTSTGIGTIIVSLLPSNKN